MDRKTPRLVETFTAVDDNGNSYEINRWQTFITTQSLGSGSQTVPGMNEYKLASGERINMIDEQTFETVHRKTKLFKT